MRRASRSALLTLAASASLMLAAPVAHADKPVFPLPSGYLVDAAGVIAAGDEEQIEASLRDYNRRTNGEVAVAIVKTIGDTSIEDYAEDLFGKWGVGNEKQDDGVLLVIALTERKARLEPGYGAEEKITDVEAKQLVTEIGPVIAAGNYAAAVDQGQRSIRRLLGDPQADAAARVPTSPVGQPERSANSGWMLFILLPFVVAMMMSSMGSRRRRRRGLGFGVPIFYGGGFGGGGGGGFGGGGGGFGGGGGGGFGGFGGGDSGGGGASGDW